MGQKVTLDAVAAQDFDTLRDAVSSDDVGNPTIGSGINSGGCTLLRVYVDVGGTSPSWDITPIFGDGTKYYAGQTRTITEDSVFDLPIPGEDDVYFKCDNSSGTSPTVTVKARRIFGPLT